MAQESLFVAICSEPSVCAVRSQDGSLLWQHPITHPIAAQVFPGTSLAWAGDLVFTEAADDYLVALHRARGSVVWENDHFFQRQQGHSEFRGAQQVLANESSVVARNAGGEIAAFDAADGMLRWTSSWKGALVTLGAGRVYVLTHRDAQSASSQSDVLRVLSTQTGQELWGSNLALTGISDGDKIGVGLERDGVAYLWGNQLHALNAQTGMSLWHQKVPVRSRRPMFGVGREYVYLIERLAGGPSSLFAYREDTGELARRVTTDDHEVFNSLLVTDDIVVIARSVASGMQVEALDSVWGTVRWVWPNDPGLLQADFSWRFVSADDILFVPIPRKTGEGIVAVRMSDGQQLWRAYIPIGLGDMLAIPTF